MVQDSNSNAYEQIVSYTTVIISRQTTNKMRAFEIKRFIKIAEVCRSLGDYNGMAAIIYGLTRPPVLVWTSAFEVPGD